MRLAILVPGKVLTAPYLRSAITDGKIQITGDFTKQEAEQLASELQGAADSSTGADVSKSAQFDDSQPAASEPNAADIRQ